LQFYCGFDFGTSNTVVTLLGENTKGQRVFSDSSVLFLPDCFPYAQKRFVGQRAVDEYVSAGMNGRFVQSIKSVLPDPAFTQTLIYEKTYTPEELVAMIIKDYKDRIEDFIGERVTGAVFGRPVKFAEEEPNDVLAENRLRAAAERCGFERIEFVYEPVAAAVRYRSDLDSGACAVVCDFGGGTADFSVILIDETTGMRIPSSHGVRVGGDDLDGEIMWNRLVPYFGYGTEYESYGNMLPVPVHIFRTICRWDQIPFLKTSEYHDDLKYIRNGARDKAAIGRLISLIEDDLGFALFQAIRSAKHELSEGDSAAVRFFEGPIELKERVNAAEFGEYINGEITDIRKAVNHTLTAAGIEPGMVGTVFLTGGTSAVREVQDQVRALFPDSDLRLDTEKFNTVSLGLAMEAKRLGLGACR
jgi:hypothetical chaperone protein